MIWRNRFLHYSQTCFLMGRALSVCCFQRLYDKACKQYEPRHRERHSSTQVPLREVLFTCSQRRPQLTLRRHASVVHWLSCCLWEWDGSLKVTSSDQSLPFSEWDSFQIWKTPCVSNSYGGSGSHSPYQPSQQVVILVWLSHSCLSSEALRITAAAGECTAPRGQVLNASTTVLCAGFCSAGSICRQAVIVRQQLHTWVPAKLF
jgi:hypothetical protein